MSPAAAIVEARPEVAPRPRLERVSRRDAALLSVGTLASGLFAYAFNVLAARTLGPEGYGPVAVLWATMFLLAVLLFRPLEQTMARAVADRAARGLDARGAARSVGRLAAVVAATATAICLAAWVPVTDALFDGRDAFTACLVVGLAGYGASYVVRGLSGGVRWFGGYGIILLADGGVRMALALPLLLLASPTIAAVAIAVAAISGAGAPLLVRARSAFGRVRGDGESPFSLAAAMRFAAPAAVIAAGEQVLVSGGPLLVLAVGGAGAAAAAGVVFAATMLVRAPVFLWQAVAASLLPNLTTLRALQDDAHLHRAVLRVALALMGFAVLLAAGALVAGPEAMALLYGDGFEATRSEIALLALGTGGLLAASTFSQAVLACDDAGRAAGIWAAAAALFIAIELVATGGPVHRVSVAFTAASGFAALALLALIWRRSP